MATMLYKETDKPQGYEYPRPSIERGQTPTPPKGVPPQPLSQKDVDAFRKSVRNAPNGERKSEH